MIVKIVDFQRKVRRHLYIYKHFYNITEVKKKPGPFTSHLRTQPARTSSKQMEGQFYGKACFKRCILHASNSIHIRFDRNS